MLAWPYRSSCDEKKWPSPVPAAREARRLVGGGGSRKLCLCTHTDDFLSFFLFGPFHYASILLLPSWAAPTPPAYSSENDESFPLAYALTPSLEEEVDAVRGYRYIDAIPCGSFTLAGQVPTGSWRDHFGGCFSCCYCHSKGGDKQRKWWHSSGVYHQGFCLLFRAQSAPVDRKVRIVDPILKKYYTALMTLFHSSFFQYRIICIRCQDHLNWWSLLLLKLWFMEPYFMISTLWQESLFFS